MKVYSYQNGEKAVFINNEKRLISENAATILDNFFRYIDEICKEIGIIIPPHFAPTEEEIYRAIHVENYKAYAKDLEKNKLAVLLKDGNIIDFTVNGESCSAVEGEEATREFFGI